MSNNVVEVKNVSKYYLNPSMFIGIKNFLTLQFLKNKQPKRLVLKNISFSLAKGESLAIIGDNGAGKSTLLYIIAGIISPTTGKIKINGRICPILELGTGFHPELTAIENIKINAILLGMTLDEVREKTNEILDFAELKQFANYPLKAYSSGMVARLAFSIAIHLDPDILLIDEILAVGDIRFQQKCREKLNSLRGEASIILVSHSRYDVEELCNRAILLKSGEIVAEGTPQEVYKEYA